MSKCALPAFSHWLIILQTHSAAKTLVGHRGLLKGWNLSSLSDVNTDASSTLAVSSSWVVSTEATVLKSENIEKRRNVIFFHSVTENYRRTHQKISLKSISSLQLTITPFNLGVLKKILELKIKCNKTVCIWLILLAGGKINTTKVNEDLQWNKWTKTHSFKISITR